MPSKHIADTLGQAAAILGVTVAVLKAAKRQGAPGFKHSRIDCAALGPWLKEHPIKEPELSKMDEQKFRKLRADADAKEFILSVKRGEYLRAQDVRVAWTTLIRTARSVLDGQASRLALVLASTTGADPAEIEERIKEANRTFIAEMHRTAWSAKEILCDKCQSQFYEKTKNRIDPTHTTDTDRR